MAHGVQDGPRWPAGFGRTFACNSGDIRLRSAAAGMLAAGRQYRESRATLRSPTLAPHHNRFKNTYGT